MRKSTLVLIPLQILFITLTSCTDRPSPSSAVSGNPPADFDLEAARTVIQEKTLLFTEAHLTKDTAFLNNIFTEDARVFPPNSAAVTGRAAISRLNEDWVNYGIHEFTETSTALYGSEQYLVDEGTYSLRFGEENTTDEGKYINVWKNDNGAWKLYSNMWNTSLP